MVKAVILVLIATGYVLGLQALNHHAQAEMAAIQEMYTHVDTLATSMTTDSQQIAPAIRR